MVFYKNRLYFIPPPIYGHVILLTLFFPYHHHPIALPQFRLNLPRYTISTLLFFRVVNREEESTSTSESSPGQED